ncbi:hypothetical protein [Roseimaritima ulvae]|nr:hypothetical protein [Roseimaritima ulvae]
MTSSAIGILFEDGILYGCQASRTLLGRFRHQQVSQPIGQAGLDQAVLELLAQFTGLSTDTPVAAGLPTGETYFATRPTATSAGSVSPRVLLRESLRSAAVRLDRLEIDVLHWQPERRSVASIIAAPSSRIDSIRQAIESAGYSLQQIEPMATALCTAAARVDTKDRGNQTITRVILSRERILAVICKGFTPVHWHEMDLPPGDEASGIVSVVRAAITGASTCGLNEAPERIVLHGRKELRPLIDMQWLHSQLPVELRWLDEPAADAPGMVRALADNLLAGEPGQFDLARIHRAATPLWDLIPWREVVGYAAVAAILFLSLQFRHNDQTAQRTALLATSPVALDSHADVRARQTELQAQAANLSKFLDNRVHWAPHLRTIVNQLPPHTQLTEIRGSAALRNQKKSSRSMPATLVLRGTCSLDDEGNVPASLDRFVEQLRAQPALAEAFPHIELSDVRRTRQQQTGIDGAEFSVVMLASKKAKER